ncbi:MAG: glycosyltransferase family 2 protein [Pseudomonadota bacterium]
MQPLVSVVLPTYNRGHTLRRAALSVLTQSYTNIELLIVDDGSSDDTSAVIDSLQDPRLRAFRFEKNKGANAARNLGVREARGVFVAFHDSDDEWFTHKLKRQVEACRISGSFACFCRLSRDELAKGLFVPKSSYRVRPGQTNHARTLLYGSYISNQTLLLHRNCFANETFDESLGRLQDWDLCIRLSAHYDFYYLAEVLVRAYTGSDRITAGTQSYLHALNQICAKNEAGYRANPSALAAVALNASALALRTGGFRDTFRMLRIAAGTGPTAMAQAILILMRRAR